MCEPTTIVAVVGLVVGAYAAYDAGETQKDFAGYTARQTEADARADLGAAQVEAARIRKARMFAEGEAAAGAAASGIDIGTGTSLRINRDIVQRSEEDAYLTVVGGKDRAARGMADAQLSRGRGLAASRAGRLGAASKLAQAGSTAYSGWKTKGGP